MRQKSDFVWKLFNQQTLIRVCRRGHKTMGYFDRAENSYDMACSLGERCMTAHQMRLNGLRSSSNPFDWLICMDLDKVLWVLMTGGRDFFRKENLMVKDGTKGHLNVTDSLTGFIALHDFREDQPFAQEYELFQEKYNRRFGRLLDSVRQASSILFVRTNVSETDYKKLLILQKLNPDARMHFLVVNTVETDHVVRLERPYKNMEVFEISDQPDIDYDIWMGNHAHWKEILSEYSLENYKDWLTDGLRAVLQDRKLVIWGFGGAGKKIVSQLKVAGNPVSVGWIVDSNPAKWGMIDDSIEVKDSSSLKGCLDSVFILICVYGDTSGIEESLARMHFPKNAVMKVVYEGLTPVGLAKTV